MDRQIKRVSFEKVSKFSRKRVAAYARVSSGKDGMLHSLAAQVSYFSALIQSNAEWEYCGVYSDEAITGTKETREGFQKVADRLQRRENRYGHHQINFPVCKEYSHAS